MKVTQIDDYEICVTCFHDRIVLLSWPQWCHLSVAASWFKVTCKLFNIILRSHVDMLPRTGNLVTGDREIESRLFYLTAPDSTLSKRGSIHQGERGRKGRSICSQRSPSSSQSCQTAHLTQSAEKKDFLVRQQNVLPTWTLFIFTDVVLADWILNIPYTFILKTYCN